MFFFFKRKKIVLDCFTNREYVHKLFPIEPSHKFYPEWWKELKSELPSRVGSMPTMKKCSGLLQFFSNGFTIPLWTDICVVYEKNRLGQAQMVPVASDSMTKIDTHPPHQRGNYLPESKYFHIKINSPWFLNCKKDIKWVFMHNVWSSDKPEECIPLPGVVDFKYQPMTNINIMIPHENTERGRIDLLSGTPLISLFPLTEDEVELRTHVATPMEIENICAPTQQISFSGKYNAIRSIMKEREKEQKKCPFGFGS